MIGQEKAGKLRQARTSLVISLFCFVVFLFTWVIQIWRYGSYWLALPMFGASSFLFFVMFVRAAPLCPTCKSRPWGVFARTAICCFAEKVSLRKAIQRTLKTFAILYILGGLIAIYIRPIITYGTIGTKYLEQKMRRPALEQFEATENALRRRLAADPNDRDAHLELGWLYYRANKLAQANAEYTTVMNLDPETPDRDALLLQAVILGEMRQALQEEKTYERLLELQDDNTEALINIGLVYMRNKLVDRAVERLEKARKLLEERVAREEKRQEVAVAEGTPIEESKDLTAMKRHLGMCYYHLAVATQLTNEKAKSGQHLNQAKRYGMSTATFSDDVERFRR